MKYNLIRINVKRLSKKKSVWEVVVTKDDEERINEDKGPNKLGFYYAPQTKSIEKAFEELKEHMCNAHIEQMKKLTKSLEELISTHLPK
jgi:hypothetical protein